MVVTTIDGCNDGSGGSDNHSVPPPGLTGFKNHVTLFEKNLSKILI